MKSKTLLTANRKPVWIRRLKISAVTVILLFLLIRLLTSSYAFCNWYLPIASGSLGFRISADEVKFTPFSGKRHLNFRGLQVEIPDRMIFTAQRFKAKISFRDLLFRHIYTLNKVQVERASLVLEDLRESKDQKTVSGLERIRVGHVAVDNFYIRYAPRNSAAYFNAFIDEFSADSMMPDKWNTIHFQTFLSWDLPDSTMLELPLHGKIRFILDRKLFPQRLQGEFESDKLNGSVYERNLSGQQLNFSFDCTKTSPETFRINRAGFRQSDGDRTVFSASATGSYNINRKEGFLLLDAEADRLAAPLIPFNFVPVDLDMQFHGKLAKKGDLLSLDADLNLNADAIKRNGKVCIPQPEVRITAKVSWDIKKRQFGLQEYAARIFSNKRPVITAGTDGPLSMTLNADESWDVDRKDASLSIHAADLPLSVLNDFLPFPFSGGKVTADYKLSVNAAKNCLVGTFRGRADDVSLLHNGKLFFRKHPITFDCEFNSEGLNKITQLVIRRFNIHMGDNNFASCAMSGRALLQSEDLELQGSLHAGILPLLGYFEPEPFRRFHSFLQKNYPAETIPLDASLRLHFSARNRKLDFSVWSDLAKIPVPGCNETAQLNFNCQGDVLFDPNQQKAQFRKINLTIPDKLDLSARLDATFPESLYSASFDLKKITPNIVRGALCLLNHEKNTKRNWLRKLHFQNLTAKADVRFSDAGNAFTIDRMKADFIHSPNRTAVFTLDRALTGTLSPFAINDTPATVVISDFPVEYLNTLTSDQCRIKLMPGNLNCEVGLTLKGQLRDLPYSASGSVDTLIFADRGTPYDFGKCTFRGDAVFVNNFHAVEYKNAFWQLEKNGEQQIITGHGTGMFSYPDTVRAVFDLDKVNLSYFQSFFGRFGKLVRFSKSDIRAKLHLDCDYDYDEVRLKLDLGVLALTPVFPADTPEQPPTLHGSIFCDYTYLDPRNTLILNKGNLDLRDQDGNQRYHVEMKGKLDKFRKGKATCRFNSDAADLRTIYSALKAVYKENADAVSDAVPDGDSLKDKVQKTLDSDIEPAAIDLQGFSTTLKTDIKNWTYTDRIRMSMLGSFTVSDNTFRAKNLSGTINQAPYTLNATANPGRDDGWELELDGKLTGLDMAPIFATFAEGKLKDRNPAATLDKLDLSLRTKGVTKKNMDTNLQVNAVAELSRISFPLTPQNKVSAIQIIVMPLTIFPRLYDLLPEKAGRSRIQKLLGGAHVDILYGRKNVELDRGIVRISNPNKRKTDLVAEKFLMKGPIVQIAGKKLMINPFHDELDIQLLTRFGGLTYPLNATGTMKEIDIDYSAAVLNLLASTFRKISFMDKEKHLWEFDVAPHEKNKTQNP